MTDVPTRVRSFAKINIGLAVGPVRPDGFHGLTTCYQTIGLHDFVTVSARPAATTSIVLETDHPGVPCTASGNCEKNTAWRMVHKALTTLDLTAEVHITLEKRLPVQGGLGAGSANAVAALLGLERELGQALPGPARLELAEEVGSDVPLFLLGGTILGLGRGEQVFPLPDAAPLSVVIALPQVGISTAQAFRDLDLRDFDRMPASHINPLTTQATPDTLGELSRVLASVWSHTGLDREPTGIASFADGNLAENPLLSLVHTGVKNDFESVVFGQHPSLREIKQSLLGDSGHNVALCAALSGSGSALFGIYRSQQAAVAAQQRVQSRGVRASLTKTLPRQGYWEQMFA